MTTPRVALATLALNEEQWLPSLYAQHRDWPGLVRWTFVESADPAYAAANPDMVSHGLSVDRTGDVLNLLSKLDARVSYWPFTSPPSADPAQGKCAARNMTLRDLCDVPGGPPDWVVVLDADEFYTKNDQARVTDALARAPRHFDACAFGLRSIWRPPSIADGPLFKYEAKGGVWSVPICRAWRWSPGLTYRTNHNTPEDAGGPLTNRMVRYWADGHPACVHMGYAAGLTARRAKRRYYEGRGEGQETVGRNRAPYVACRLAWETWRPGDELPAGARVVEYTGPVPEVFR